MTPEMRAAMEAAAAAERELSGGDSAPPGAGDAAGSAPVEDAGKAARLAELKAENMQMLELVLSLVEPFMPNARKYYTAEACEKIATAGAVVEEKHGFSIGSLFGKYGDEIALAVAVVGPVSVPLVGLVRQAMARRVARQVPQAPAGEAPPEGAKVVPLNPAGGGDAKAPPAG